MRGADPVCPARKGAGADIKGKAYNPSLGQAPGLPPRRQSRGRAVGASEARAEPGQDPSVVQAPALPPRRQSRCRRAPAQILPAGLTAAFLKFYKILAKLLEKN